MVAGSGWGLNCILPLSLAFSFFLRATELSTQPRAPTWRSGGPGTRHRCIAIGLLVIAPLSTNFDCLFAVTLQYSGPPQRGAPHRTFIPQIPCLSTFHSTPPQLSNLLPFFFSSFFISLQLLHSSSLHLLILDFANRHSSVSSTSSLTC